MEKNVFENGIFGSMYSTKCGKRGILLAKSLYTEIRIEGEDTSRYYLPDGRCCNFASILGERKYDIVQKLK